MYAQPMKISISEYSECSGYGYGDVPYINEKFQLLKLLPTDKVSTFFSFMFIIYILVFFLHFSLHLLLCTYATSLLVLPLVVKARLMPKDFPSFFFFIVA